MEQYNNLDRVMETGRESFLRKACIGVLVVSIIFSSCNKNDDVSKGTFKRMNIEDAKTLFIVSSNSVSKMYGVKNASLKSTSEDDEIYEITYLDNNNKPIEGKIPNYIYDAGDFLVVIFEKNNNQNNSGAYEKTNPDAYFVRKTDGTAYKIPDEYFPSVNGDGGLFFNHNTNIRRFRNTNIIRDLDFLNFCYDKDNNIYYTVVHYNTAPSMHALPHIVYKATITSSTVKFEQVSENNDNVWGYNIDYNGNIIYKFGDKMKYGSNGSFSEPIIIIGRYVDIPIEIYRFVWVGNDGIMALREETADRNPSGGITTISEPRYCLMKMENGEFVKKREIKLDFSNGYPSSYNINYVQGRVIYNHSFGSTFTLVDITNENSYREIPCTVEANIVINDELYHFDRNTFSLTHINIDNGNTTPVFAFDKSVLSDYLIACIMDVTENSVMFGAYRLSDRMNVVAKIEENNELTILQINSGDVSTIMPLIKR